VTSSDNSSNSAEPPGGKPPDPPGEGRRPRQSSSDSSIIGGIPDAETPADSLLRTVTKHAARYDYEQAIQILEAVPPAKRGQVLEDRLRELRERVAHIERAHQEIETAQREGNDKGIVTATRRLMQLKPNDPLIKQVLQKYGSLDEHGKYHLPSDTSVSESVGDDPPRMIAWGIGTAVVAFLAAYTFVGWLLKSPRQELIIRVPPGQVESDLTVEIAGRQYRPGDPGNIARLSPGEYEYHATRNGETVKQGLLVVDKQPAVPLELDLETGNWALRFNGRSSYLSLPRLAFDLSSPFTFECWCTPTGDKPGMILDTEGDVGFAVGISVESNWVIRYPTADGYQSAEVGWCEPGCRVHLACAAERERIHLFVNGRRMGTVETGPRLGTTMQGYLVGTDHSEDGPFYEGTLESVHLASNTRYQSSFQPPDEIEADAATLLLLRNTEHRSDLVVDHSGNSHHARQHDTEWDRDLTTTR